MPIFRGGTLRAQQRAAYDAFDRAAAQYRSTVLNAFANVANVLAALQLDAENVRTQLYAEQTAEQSLEITNERFQAGEAVAGRFGDEGREGGPAAGADAAALDLDAPERRGT